MFTHISHLLTAIQRVTLVTYNSWISFTVYYVFMFMLEGSVQNTGCSEPFCVTFYFKLFRNSHVAMDCKALLCGRESKLGK